MHVKFCLFVISHCRYKPAPEDKLLKAFHALDVDAKGFLTQEELSKYMTEEGQHQTNYMD